MPYTYQKNENNNYFCLSCKFTSPNQNTMHYHYKTHSEKKEHTCSKCDKNFTSKRALTLHCTSKHGTPKEVYECSQCDFENLTKGNCRIHYVRIHCKSQVSKILTQDENGYTCSECKNSFNGATSYYYHAFECLKLENTQYCKKKLNVD